MTEKVAHDYLESPEARHELLNFLSRPSAPNAPTCDWAARLAHWWDENPSTAQSPHRGLVLRHAGKMTGFVGVIPTAYAWQGEPLPVLLTSTFDVEPEHIQQGYSALLRLRTLLRETPIFHTTPSQPLWRILVRMKARAETQAFCDYHLRGSLAGFSRRSFPVLDTSVSAVTRLDAVRALAAPYEKADRLEKWRSMEALRWQFRTPTRTQHFLGAVDAAGTLHSFLALSPCQVRGLPALEIMDYFTSRGDLSELHALAGLLTHQGHHLGLPRTPLWIVRSFPGDDTWTSLRGVMRREHTVCHFFMLPPHLREVPKRSVMAEGDLVL